MTEPGAATEEVTGYEPVPSSKPEVGYFTNDRLRPDMKEEALFFFFIKLPPAILRLSRTVLP